MLFADIDSCGERAMPSARFGRIATVFLSMNE